MTNKPEQPISPKKPEQEDPAEQAALAELRASLPDFVSQIRIINSVTDRREIEISFTKPAHELSSREARAFYNQLKEALTKHGLEKGRLQSSGGERESYLLNKLKINGRTNWRRWLYYSENMSPDIIALLDVLAEDIGDQNGSDDADRFCNFVEDGFKKGLLTKEEYDKIHNQLYQAQNVG